MSRLHEVSSGQLRDISSLVHGLLTEVDQPEGCASDPNQIVHDLRAIVETIEVARQLPAPPRAGSYDPEEFLYLSQPDRLLRLPIEELDLTTAVYNCLKREGADTLGLLLEWTEADLLDLRNFGIKSLKELLGKLGEDLHLSRHDQGFDPPAGDQWERLVGRTVLRSRLAHVLVDSLRDTQENDWVATRKILYILRVDLRIKRVGTLLTYTPADILALDWTSKLLDPDEALQRIINTLANYRLQLRTL